MNKPYNFFEYWMKDLKEQNKTPMQAYQEFMQNMLKSSQPKEEAGSQEFFQEMMKTQMEMGKMWFQGVQTMLENFAPQKKEASMFDSWSKMYSAWNSQFGKPFTGQASRNDAAETFKNIMTFSQNYMQLYQLFQPILEQLNMGKKPKKNAFQEFWESISLEKYNEIASQVFGGLTPEQSENFLQQIASFSQKLLDDLNKQTGGTLTKAIESVPDLMHNLQATQYQAFGKLQKSINPFLKMIPDSKEKQLLELNIQLQDDYAFYYIKSNEMQSLVQKTAQKALEQTIKELIEKVKNNPEHIITFEEATNLWMDIAEPMMIELYRSEPFGKLQAEALAASTAIKNRFEKQMELLLEPLPIAPRSEIDELNATIHELRRKVRALENELSRQQLNHALQSKEAKPTPKNEEAIAENQSKSRGRPKKTQ
jgi:cytochrome P450